MFHTYSSKLPENFQASEENVRRAHSATAGAVRVKSGAPVPTFERASPFPFLPPSGRHDPGHS